MADQEPRIVVRANGPYRVEGGVPLLRTAIVKTEHGEPVAWDEGPEYATGPTYELCRCGNSSTKPFCDSTHERIAFDGTETADRGPIAGRRSAWEGEAGMVLYDDITLCTHAGFCRNRFTGVWEMLEEAGDADVRDEFTGMVSRCPSGRLAYAVEPDPEPVEPSFEPSIGVEPNASLWIRGGVPVVSEDGTPYEVRNRQTLCRCGHSSNKPFCDGSHVNVGFDDPAMPG
jgi:CDGSH-type Zn-finger protein